MLDPDACAKKLKPLFPGDESGSVMFQHQVLLDSPALFGLVRRVPEQEAATRLLELVEHLVEGLDPKAWNTAQWSSRPPLPASLRMVRMS